MILFLLLLLFLVALVFIIDWIPQFYTWQSRIKIGRYETREDWHKKVESQSLKWLSKTPTIKLTDNKRLIVIDMLSGNYEKKAIQHWQQAALLLGLTEQYYQSKDPQIKSKINAFVTSLFNDEGEWHKPPTEIDSVMLGYAIMNIDWIDHNKLKMSYNALAHVILKLKGKDGTIAYRRHLPKVRYVDTIGFICPFLVKYGLLFNSRAPIELAVKQILTYNQFAMLPQQPIPCHTYTTTTLYPGGLYGWGRGMGWYAFGLIDSWKLLPNDHESKAVLTEAVIAYAKTIVSLQHKRGSWSWQVTSPHAQFDSSATATLAWFLSNVDTIPEIAPQAKIAVDKALDYLQTVTRRNGAIDFSQGDTKGIGVYSQEFDILPFTQGFALRTLNNLYE